MIATLFRIALCACALATAGAIAQAPPTSVFIDDLTWTELRDGIAAGKTTIIVPIGATEQNGPWMALGKHNVRAKALSEKIARALGNALVAPVISYVPRAKSIRRRRTCASGNDHRSRCDVRKDAGIRGTEVPGPVSRHRLSRRSRRLPKANRGRVATQSRMAAQDTRDARETTALRGRRTFRCSSDAATAMTKSDRMPGWLTPR
jgi:hypothetical protein